MSDVVTHACVCVCVCVCVHVCVCMCSKNSLNQFAVCHESECWSIEEWKIEVNICLFLQKIV